LSEKSSCVIVGRCADYVLRDSAQKCVHLFVYADIEDRIKRISQKYDLTPEKAKEKINKIQKTRKAYYNYYSNQEWGNVSNYDMCINSARLGLEKAADVICDFVKKATEE